MKLMNYMNLNHHPIQLSFMKDRTSEFEEIYHAHQGMELLYVHTGKGRVISNGEMLELQKGCLFCFRPFHIHSVKVDLHEETYVRSLCVFEPSILENYLLPFEALHSFFLTLWKGPHARVLFSKIPEEEVVRLISNYRMYTGAVNSSGHLENEAIFLLALINLLRHYGQADMSKPDASASFNKFGTAALIQRWLEEHFDEEFKMERLSEAFHLTPNYLSYLFKKETGSNITDYLSARRLQEACTLLRTTPLTVQEIGYRIGFNNFSYFCKFFKKNVGVTPYRFRKSQE